MKKIISIIIVTGLLTSQVGCGNKVLTTPLNRAQFDQNYTYNIHAAQNTELLNISGSNIQNFEDRIHITQNNQTKYLLHNQIQSIEGISSQSSGTKALEGMGIGAAIGAPVGAISFYAASVNTECDDDCAYVDLISGVIGFAIGATAGGLIGLGIGSMVPAKHKVQIVPFFSPSTQNMSGGANLQVNF